MRPLARRLPLPAAVLLAAGLLLAAPARAAEPAIEVRLAPDELAAGDLATFSVQVTGGAFNSFRVDPDFALDNFEVVSGPHRLDNLTYVDGSVTRRLRLTWRLRAVEPGRAAVRRLSVEAGGRTYRLDDLEARVGRPEPGRVQDPRGSPRRTLPFRHLPDALSDLFERRWPLRRPEPPEVRLAAAATPQRPWVGQQVLYTLYLDTQTHIRQLNPQELPDFRGLWVEELPRRREMNPVEMDGELFYRTPLFERALYPLRPGRFTVEPAAVEMLADLPQDDLLGRDFSRLVQVARRSNAVTLDVRPLPPVPAALAGRFHGLVGDTSVVADLSTTRVRAGEAATLELEVTGRGNVAALPVPELPAVEGLEVLPPQEESGQEVAGTSIVGRRLWRWALVPQRPGTYRLPPVEIPYFDPASGEYRVAATRALRITATPAAAAAAGALHPLRNAALLDEDAGRWSLGEALPWLFAAPWLLLLLLAWRRHRRGEADRPAAGLAAAGADPRRAGGRPVRPRAALAAFEAALAEAGAAERPRETALATEAAWRRLLADLAAVPPEAPSSRWPAYLAEAGAAERDGAELDELMHDLHYLRHAPQLSAIGELRRELVDRSRRLGRRLVAAKLRPPARRPEAAATEIQPRPEARPEPGSEAA